MCMNVCVDAMRAKPTEERKWIQSQKGPISNDDLEYLFRNKKRTRQQRHTLHKNRLELFKIFLARQVSLT